MRICFVGDSFVNGTSDPHCLGWAGRVCAVARRDGRDVTYYNLGVRRDTSADVAARWEREVAARLPRPCQTPRGQRTAPDSAAAPLIRDVAVGFLYHSSSGKVLLHLRDADKPPNAGKWAFFGGRAESEDGDDLLATWCREIREELGVSLDTARVVPLRHGTYDNGLRWHDFYCEWPSLNHNFALIEGQRWAWFTLDQALDLPDLADYAREDLILFRDRLTRPEPKSTP